MNRCYLCGGKLNRGVCQECGLDNVRMTRRNYRLNESMPLHVKKKQVEVQRQESLKYAKQYKAKQQKLENLGKPQSAKSQKARTVKKEEKKKGIKPIAVLGIIYAAIALFNMGADVIHDEVAEPVPETLPVLSYAEDGTYDLAVRELSETGESYGQLYGPGFYEVGVHIPEGSYVVECAAGTYGYICLEDDENGIYLYPSFEMEDSEIAYSKVEDIRLYDGAVLEIYGNIQLAFSSYNAQTEAMEGMENPNLALGTGVIPKGENTYIVGNELPEGVYDFSIEEGYSSIHIYSEDGAEVSFDKWFSLCGDSYESTCSNVVLLDGMWIAVSGDEVNITPSLWISTEDYQDFYK